MSWVDPIAAQLEQAAAGVDVVDLGIALRLALMHKSLPDRWFLLAAIGPQPNAQWTAIDAGSAGAKVTQVAG
jgi:hypothetical protein